MFFVYIVWMLDLEKVTKLRKKLGLSQEAAAKLAGFSGRSYWNNIETGRVADPQLSTIEAIATALGVKAKDLLK